MALYFEQYRKIKPDRLTPEGALNLMIKTIKKRNNKLKSLDRNYSENLPSSTISIDSTLHTTVGGRC